ncbi:hypothetical protein YIM1640_19630 [Thermus oshimai]|jgi:hypothetical protein|uniref:Uncharacterized protein n=1 Tax=Thermus oshimai JL-2 TaxID=751945 RepID=K7QWQ4_THEOS|nr:hypothetical protein [Thermus oshimai]AFV76038.1 hypothetical protein Theos_0985 [Thermus oshimai JL-2]
MRAYRLLALLALLGSSALAQTTDSHTVTVNIPSVLQLTLDATDYLFDFADATLTGSETVNVGGTPYTKASQAAYYAFLDTATGTQDFAPTSVNGTGGADYGTVTVRSNRAQWTVSVASVGALPSPLSTARLKVYAEKVSGKGASWTGVPSTLTSGMTLFNAGSGGQGRSVYRLYYLLTMDINDDIPLTGYNHTITVDLQIASP